jgi:hypothetical protein
LYRLQARVRHEIDRLEAEIAAARLAGEPVARLQTAPCGSESKYQRHIRKGIPFPEDQGGLPCGCRGAHRAYEALRQARRREAS